MIFVSFLLGCWICNRKLRWLFIYFIFNIPDRFYFFLFTARRRDPLLGKFFFSLGGGLFLALAISQLNYRIWSCILRQTCNNQWESSGSWVLVSELVFFLIVYHFVEWFSTDTDQISVFKFRFEIGLSHF